MKIDAGRDKVDEGTRPRGRPTRLAPAVRPGLVEEGVSATSQRAVDQSKPEKSDVSPDREPKANEAVRGSTTTDAWRGRLRYYGLALLLVALGVLMRMVLTRLVGPGMPTYITFFPFVMLAALIGGWGPGLLATLATAAVVNYWLLPSAGWFTIERSVDAVGLAFFCVMGIFVSIVAELYRRIRDHLDELVSMRTAALRVANARLQRRSEEVQSQAEALQLETQKLTATEATLRRSESHLAQAQQIASVGSWSWDIGADRLYWSDETYRLYGLQPGGCVARHNDFLRFVHPEDRQRIETFAREALVRSHYSTDYRIIRTDGEERHVHSEGETIFDDQGDPVKAEGILQDITERKRAEEVLRVKDSAIASSLNAIAMADLQGRLTYVNPAFLKLWGHDDPQQVLGKSVLDFWKEPQRAQEVVQAIQNGGGWTGELAAVKKDGTHLNLYLSTSTVRNDKGAPLCMMASFVDVTERKRAEEALRLAKTFTDKLLNAPLDTVFLFEPSTGKPVRWNQRFAEVSGYGDEEIAGMKAPDDFYDADDLAKATEATVKVLAEGQGVVELSLITKEGVHIPFEYAGTVVQDEEGKTLLLSVGRDITEHKRMEETLRESEARFRALTERSTDVVAIFDPEGTITYISPSIQALFGFATEEIVGRSLFAFIHPEDAEQTQALIVEGLRDPTRTLIAELRTRHKNGQWRWIAIAGRNLIADFAVGGIVVNFQDITERKQVEEALRESEEKFRILADTSQASISLYQDGHIVYANPASEAIFGYSLDERRRMNFLELIHPDFQRLAQERMRALLEGGPYGSQNEYKIIRKDGQERWVLSSGSHLTFRGKPAVMVSSMDITERKQAEEALRASEQRYRKLFEANLAGVYLSKLDGTILDFNDAMMRMVGYDSREELLGRRSSDFYVNPESRPELVRLLQRDGIVPARETVLRRKDGSTLHAYGSAVLLTHEQTGEPYVQGVVIDITQRKRAEEALKESEEKYRYIVETAMEGIVMVDAEARVVFANKRWSDIFGYSLEEARHITHFDMVFPEDQAQMRQRWESRKRGVKESYECRFRRKDGRPVWTLIGVAPRFDPERRFLGTLVMVTDITARKQAEEALREWSATLETRVAERTAQLERRARQLQKMTLEVSLAEDRERKRLAEILHDDLQQIIAGAKFHLNLIRNRVKHDASLHATALEIDQMLKEAIEKSRGLSHELSPAVLYQGDFTEALDWLARQIQTKHGLVVHVHAPGKVDLQSDAIRPLLYRTAQELLFNVVKHARVKEASVRVQRRGPYVCLSVSDHGRGFNPTAPGFTLGFGLLSIRERIELLGGRMKIRSAEGKGSTFFIAVPDSPEPEDRGQKTDGGKKADESLPPSVFCPPSSVLRVLLADDHKIVREGLRSLLRGEVDIEIVGEAAHGREAVDLALRLEPDVVIMDVSMPLIDGDVATRRIKEHRPQTRVIALSTYSEPETIQKMYRAGAEGYVLKTASSEELLAAIRGEHQAPSITPHGSTL